MKQKYQKRSFSLTELLVALCLFALISATFFGFLKISQVSEFAMSDATKKEQELLIAHARLKQLFFATNMPKNASKSGKSHYYFFTEPNSQGSSSSLVFTFKNGVDKEPKLSADVLGRLSFDNNELALTIWPNPAMGVPQNTILRKEILLKDIAQCQFLFSHFDPDDKSKQNQIDWDTNWPKNDTLPLLVKIILTWKGAGKAQEYTFCFPVSDSITYVEV